MTESVEQVVEKLAAYEEVGCVEVINYFSDIVWGDSAELFAKRVMPRFSG